MFRCCGSCFATDLLGRCVDPLVLLLDCVCCCVLSVDPGRCVLCCVVLCCVVLCCVVLCCVRFRLDYVVCVYVVMLCCMMCMLIHVLDLFGYCVRFWAVL